MRPRLLPACAAGLALPVCLSACLARPRAVTPATPAAEAAARAAGQAGPGGLPGNDDSGAMSAWYVFHAMGFYPNAGMDHYLVTSPRFERVTIKLGAARRSGSRRAAWARRTATSRRRR